MNDLYFGCCQNCSYLWQVFGRIANHCPECGIRLFRDSAELIKAKENCVHGYFVALASNAEDKRRALNQKGEDNG